MTAFNIDQGYPIAKAIYGFAVSLFYDFLKNAEFAGWDGHGLRGALFYCSFRFLGGDLSCEVQRQCQ